MPGSPSAAVLAAIERRRKALWAHCYRMTGARADADDLCQEAIARAIERSAELADVAKADAWLFRIATTVCLDHLRRVRRTRTLTELVDPIVFDELPVAGDGPETSVILRDDVRLAVIVALQALAPKQRAALLLHDVCGLPLEEVATTLGTNAHAAKAALHRARAALVRARRHDAVDVPVDAAVVDALARALAERSVERLAQLLADDVWGVVDGGGVIPVAARPTLGARALVRRFANLLRRIPLPVACRIERVNGEPTVIVTLPTAGAHVFSTVHVETREGRIVAMRVVRDPAKLLPFQPGVH